MSLCVIGSYACPVNSAHARELSPLGRGVGQSVKKVYQASSAAVVAVTCRHGTEGFFGSGVVVDPSGLVVTSSTVVPRGAARIRVFLAGGRLADARLLLVDKKTELSLLRLRNASKFFMEGSSGLDYLRLGESRPLRIGDPVFSLGNSFRSIDRDDQVTIAAGIVSGVFRLEPGTESESKYHGTAIETTAALNNGMDGGPLVDARGQLIGILSLNYSRNRWLGTAVPIDSLKPVLRPHRDWFDDRFSNLDATNHAATLNAAIFGAELEEVAGSEVRVVRVRPDSPAGRAGLRSGDRLSQIASEDVSKLDALRKRLKDAKPGARLELEVRRGNETVKVSVRLGGRF
ncbi:MAG: S1C family serine protease [Planctomycetota bacterium]